jgi:hypothetical protein
MNNGDMTDAALESLRFPVGKFAADPNRNMTSMIDQVAAAPAEIRTLAARMTPAQLATAYRPGGWTGAQVIHHVVDSHVNAYIRTRFALVEDNFTVKPYDESVWAELADAKSTSPADVAASLDILGGLHTRWTTLLRTVTPEQFQRPLLHPERGPMTLDTLIQLYAWHGRHHAGHLLSILQ